MEISVCGVISRNTWEDTPCPGWLGFGRTTPSGYMANLVRYSL